MTRLASVALVFAFLAGCEDSTSPEEACGLPPPDTTLDPSALRVGAVIFACGRWVESKKPSEPQAIVDIFFGRRGPEDPPDRPLAEHLFSITNRGGTVCHQFNFPAVRARIDVDRVPELGANEVYEVPDLRRYDWNVTVGYRRPLQDADSVQFVDLGGEVRSRSDFINALSGALPDRSIPVLRNMEAVEYVEAQGVYCLAGTAG